MRIIHVGLLASGLALASTALQAQTAACTSGDEVCYQREYEQACAERNVATVETCGAWIRSVDERVRQNDRAAQLMQGHAWMAIANHLEASAALKRRSRENGIAIFRQLAATNRSDAEALLALAAFTEDSAERVKLLRQVVALRPGGVIAVDSLALELEKQGGRENLLEAADVLQRAWAAAQTGRPRRDLADRAIRLFEEAGAQDRARELRQQVQQSRN